MLSTAQTSSPINGTLPIAPGLQTVTQILPQIFESFGIRCENLTSDKILTWLVKQPILDFGSDTNNTFENSLRTLGARDVESLRLTFGLPKDRHPFEAWEDAADPPKRIATGLLIGQYKEPVPNEMKYLAEYTELSLLLSNILETLKEGGIAILDEKSFHLSESASAKTAAETLTRAKVAHVAVEVELTAQTKDKFYLLFKGATPKEAITQIAREIEAA